MAKAQSGTALDSLGACEEHAWPRESLSDTQA
eukprot:CAMPEP_0204121076 /NCGR_PEP_ID=MMETSP0361-20130328/8006_1 /ASSEMBLY_ACC=CAM_ASM_000343 /TAXON_ID=268821 /ORGANISM="Scrippsiella Hangoei, Strain SHTV-5" /LENGTH=31 /DNA_ID= /DNA_START= /DNA_END= /DNA_ORIENTATION=